jgi:peptidoglycan/xylan/chitin deacetylase (PgdA/CDA1 family)
VTIGAHSHAHGLLTQMSGADTTADVAKSRQLLQQWTGQPVEHFAYPSGEYDARVRENVMSCGFRTAVTTEKRLWRPGCDSFAIPRMSVGRYDSASIFRLALGGGAESVLRAQF